MNKSYWQPLRLLMLFLVLGVSGCATGNIQGPRMGACLVDEAGGWFCKDADKVTVPKDPASRYVCLKVQEWDTLMRACKQNGAK